MDHYKTRKEMKQEVKALYKGNWWLAFQNLILPGIVCLFICLVSIFVVCILCLLLFIICVSSKSVFMLIVAIVVSACSFVFVIAVCAGLAPVVRFRYLDWLRTGEIGSPSLDDVLNKKYYKGSSAISMLALMYVFLWSFLFVIPGIIKIYSYSASLFIYKDKVDAGEENISYLDCINESKALMKGNKWRLFVLQWSLFGWQLLVEIPYTFHLAGVWITPYLTLVYTNFYRNLIVEKRGYGKTSNENVEDA